MPAPFKKGIDYFPVDVGIMSDRKFRRVKMKHGYMAVNVYIALLCLIYSDNGYYLDYSDKYRDDIIWEILGFMQGEHQPKAEKIVEVIEDLVACELFSGDLFYSKLLTSKRIQKNFYTATVDRKEVDVNFDIWLLDEKEMQTLSKRHLILQKFLNRPNNRDNRPNNEDNRPNYKQSKVKESKVKESKVYTAQNELVDLDICPFFEELWQLYPNQKGKNKITAEALQEINDIGKEKMIQAVKAYRLEVSESDMKYIKRGNTFFNGDYKDYLDKPTAADLIVDNFDKVPVFTGA